MPIRLVENFRALFYAPFYATHALGFYAREGVDVELIDSPSPGSAISSILDGTIDLSWGGPMRVMKAHDIALNAPLVCFCEVAARDPFLLVGRGGGSAFRLADLARLRVATVSEVPTPWLCLQHDLRQNGIDPYMLERVGDRTMSDNVDVLRRGEIDVAQVFEPYATMAVSSGIGDVLYAASARGPTVYTTFLATRDGINKNRAQFAARAVHRMQAWLSDHAAEDLAAAVAPFYPNISSDLLVSGLRRYHGAGVWAASPEVSREGFARLAGALLSGGFLARIPSYEECVDQSLQGAGDHAAR